MLTAIKIGNFKAFAEAQRIPIRPLTLIYGANSSGKSSVLHSMILTRHAQETGDLDVHRTNVGGESVDLGGFRQFIHGRNADLRVHLEWEITAKDFSKRLTNLLPGLAEASIGVNIGVSGGLGSLGELSSITPKQFLAALIEDERKKNNQAEVERLEGVAATAEDKLTLEEVYRLHSTLRVENCWLDINGKRFMSMSARSTGHLQVDVLDRDHPVAIFLVENLITAYSTSDHVDSKEIDALAVSIDEVVSQISFEVRRLFPLGLAERDKYGSHARGVSLVTVKKETRLEDLKNVIYLHLPFILEEILVGISDIVTGEFSKITYLGPLRTYPSRHIGFTEVHDPNWVAGGGFAWDKVRRDSAIREKVNEWLGDEKKLSTTYELRIRYLLTIDSIRDNFADLASRAISKIYDSEADDIFGEIEQAVNDIPDRLEKLESLFSDIQELVLFDKRTRTPVSHRDVGIGISQVLPVLVTCFSSREKIIAMEQPEIHLHPALQAELGDVFIEAALSERRNTLLIETHSEHLLLRIMRRIRETTAGKTTNGLLPVHPEDVMVLFVKPDGSRSIILEMPINETGDLVKPWPGGFFEEDFKELF